MSLGRPAGTKKNAIAPSRAQGAIAVSWPESGSGPRGEHGRTGLGRVAGVERHCGKALAVGERVLGQARAYGGQATRAHGQLGDAETGQYGREQRGGGRLTADAPRLARRLSGGGAP